MWRRNMEANMVKNLVPGGTWRGGVLTIFASIFFFAIFKTDKIKRYIICFGGSEILSKFR
jgi:hypothetical protein